ncbi:hypothetical protein ASD37_12495 [Mycobacterium sp. Root135]|uniref:ferredoxin n=1 Tax=Mycobacterium sp. Root135 TaxID=1736457 RepID=UPI0006FE418C|nr:ferredoxin [Mycobacterium sp. Root135]KQY06930.1 hypothetical protein ASD37_12495 [Mycobacterium sp. Root135]
MRMVIDLELCVGHGRCYAEAPDAIDADDEGRAVALLVDIPDSLRGAVHMAAECCPEQAIRVDEH